MSKLEVDRQLHVIFPPFPIILIAEINNLCVVGFPAICELYVDGKSNRQRISFRSNHRDFSECGMFNPKCVSRCRLPRF